MLYLQRVLIVTIFGRSSPSDPPVDLRGCENQVSQALHSLIPNSHLNILDRRLLRLSVCRLSYTLVDPPENIHSLRHSAPFTHLERTLSCEIILDLLPPALALALNPTTHQPPYPRFKLAVFDMDSTLIDQEVIDELARSIGLVSAVSAITTRAMNGEIDFSQSLIERVALLKGVRADIWKTLQTDGSITIAKGARELIASLKAMGVRTAVVSGGSCRWRPG